MELAIINSKGTHAAVAPSVFSPDLGDNNARIWEFTAAAQSGKLDVVLDSILRGAGKEEVSLDDARLLFSASILRDVLRAGGRVWVRDSRLLVAWPDREGPAGRRNAQAAMAAVRELRPLKTPELKRVPKPILSRSWGALEPSVLWFMGICFSNMVWETR